MFHLSFFCFSSFFPFSHVFAFFMLPISLLLPHQLPSWSQPWLRCHSARSLGFGPSAIWLVFSVSITTAYEKLETYMKNERIRTKVKNNETHDLVLSPPPPPPQKSTRNEREMHTRCHAREHPSCRIGSHLHSSKLLCSHGLVSEVCRPWIRVSFSPLRARGQWKLPW